MSIAELSAAQLQRIFARALRTDENWGKIHSTIRNLACAVHGGVIYAMALLPSAQWLVTLSRHESRASILSLWDLSSTQDIHSVASVEVPLGTKMSATFQEDGTSILVAVLSGNHIEE